MFRDQLFSYFLFFFYIFISHRVGLFPIVSANHILAGLNAKEWCDHCMGVIGSGKGGGKAESALANIPGGQEVLDLVLKSAREYAASKVIGVQVV